MRTPGPPDRLRQKGYLFPKTSFGDAWLFYNFPVVWVGVLDGPDPDTALNVARAPYTWRLVFTKLPLEAHP